MPRPPRTRRGTLNRRFAENIVKQTLPRNPPRQYGRPMDEYESQPSVRPVPHYEDDPYWNNKQNQRETRSTKYQSYGESHPERIFNRDLRDTLLSRRSKQYPGNARGKRLKKPEPPLAMCGIPHLNKSFVSDSEAGKFEKNEGECSSNVTSTVNSNNLKLGLDVHKANPSALPVQNASGDAITKVPEVACNAKRDGSKPDIDAINSCLGNENSVANNKEIGLIPNLEEKSFDNNFSEFDFNREAQSSQQGTGNVGSHNIEGQTANENLPKDSREMFDNPPLALPDSAVLEKETKKYYEELLGVKEKDEKKEDEEIRPRPSEESTISASQVANITKKYDTEETEKAKEEARQEEIQTAWSILHQYWEFVRENPYDFNGWTYLLTHVENMNDIQTARSAFEGFLPLYPYCFAYWKKLSDMELKHKEKERAIGILMIGVQSIPLCMDLWMPLLETYISYAKEKDFPPHHVQRVYEYGLENMGNAWHSSSFWEGCISYELDSGNLVGVVDLYKRLLTTPTKLYNKHWDHFLALVRDHHPCNLLSSEEYEALRKQTCEELKIKYTPSRYGSSKSLKKTPQPEDKLSTCMKEKLVASFIKTHESNEEEVDKRWKFEERIKRPYFHIKPLDKKQIKNWKDYLEFELSEGDPLRIVPLFERCLVACALYEEFWCQYCSYMERHVQDIIDGKFKNVLEENFLLSSSSVKKVASEESGSSVSDDKVSEINASDGKAPISVSDGQVNSENVVSVKNVESNNDSVMRGSAADTPADGVTKLSDSVVKHSDKNEAAQFSNTDNCQEQSANDITDSTVGEKGASAESDTNAEQCVVSSEPPTMEQIKHELCAHLSVGERVLKCPPLTPEWILNGVSWEDVRQIYRRGAWIHCPSKPSLLMQWAEFEEIQGNLDTARELLNTVTAKYPTVLKGRMQLIELERRAGCHERVEELYIEASRVLTLPRQRSWLAIKYARFLFKVLMEADRALAVLRKALKKDRGYVHLYHHVFDICYQRQPLDCRGVLASVMLALASKELSTEDKYWFAYKRVQFLREHGDIRILKAAIKEHDELKELAGMNVSKESKTSSKKTKDVKKEEEEETKKEEKEVNENEVEKKEEVAAENAPTSEVPAPEAGFAVPTSVPSTNLQFPVPFFSADGGITYSPMEGYGYDHAVIYVFQSGITYSPMEGYGYGHADPSQSLPTAQEVLQETTTDPDKKNYHNVPPSWELNLHIGNSYGYGKANEHQWQQVRQSKHEEYNNLVANSYPEHLKDVKEEEMHLPIAIKIDHLRPKPGPQGHSVLPDLSQPPPGHMGQMRPPGNADLSASNNMMLQAPPGNHLGNRSLLPISHGNQAANKVLLPTPPGMPPGFARPPPPIMGMGPPGLHPPGVGPPGNFQGPPPPDECRRPFFDESQHFGKRPHPDEYRSEGERPYKLQNMSYENPPQYRAEYDSNYTSSPGPSAPPSHKANFGAGDAGYDRYPHERRGNDPPADQYPEERPSYNVENSRLNDPKRYSLRDENFDSTMIRELPQSGNDGLSVNVPDWLMNDGGELCLSDTNNGESVIRYWPNFMTSQGYTTLFRVLRKRLKWYQRRLLVEGQWQNLPHLLSWIGPCDYSHSGVTLEKNTEWSPEIVDLLHRLIRYTTNQYNCCYLALYRNGYDNSSWTSENHLALRKNPSIASVSLGATRVFEMRRKNGSGYLRFPLQPGSLLLMEGATQEDWTHQFPKQPNVPGERMHLIFRKFYMIEGLTI